MSSPNEPFTLRDYIDMRLSEMEKRIYAHFDSMDKALRIQANEYERRLQDLNHENARILAAQEKSVSVEKFEAFELRFNEYVRTTSKALDLSQGTSIGKNALWAYALGAVGFIGGIIGIIVAVTN